MPRIAWRLGVVRRRVDFGLRERRVGQGGERRDGMTREPSQGSSGGRREEKRGTGCLAWRALWRIAGCLALAAPTGVHAQSLETLKHLSIEQLADVQVTSVFKRPASLSQTPAAVYVITGDDIRRSGVTSLPEALRLAPNLEVARVSAHDIRSRRAG